VLQIQSFEQSSAQWKSQLQNLHLPLHSEADLSWIELEQELGVPVVENIVAVLDARAWVVAKNDTKTMMKTSLTDGAFFTAEILVGPQPSGF
jgi:ABC-type antimicrobial peptide transport system ATPase subunit